MHAERDVLASLAMALEPFDAIGKHVGRRHLDRGRQVHDHRALGAGVPRNGYGVADLERVVELGAREALRRILQNHLRFWHFVGLALHAQGALHRQLQDLLLGFAEHDAALQLARRVVQMDDGALRAAMDSKVRSINGSRA